MTRTYVATVKLRKWFPPRDRFAACIARLCILREDLFLEMMGVWKTRIAVLDEHSTLWRKMFFWRSLVKTIWEIRKTIETLNTIPEFKRVLQKQPVAWQKQYAKMVKVLNKHATLVEDVRNSLGGHVLFRTVEEALDGMSFDVFNYIEVGETEKRTHYRFANTLVLEMVLKGVDEEKRLEEISRHFRSVADLLPVFTLTGILLTIYADARRLLD
jgi:hypothetical protein